MNKQNWPIHHLPLCLHTDTRRGVDSDPLRVDDPTRQALAGNWKFSHGTHWGMTCAFSTTLKKFPSAREIQLPLRTY